jgi:hypothetical protein
MVFPLVGVVLGIWPLATIELSLPLAGPGGQVAGCDITLYSTIWTAFDEGSSIGHPNLLPQWI